MKANPSATISRPAKGKTSQGPSAAKVAPIPNETAARLANTNIIARGPMEQLRLQMNSTTGGAHGSKPSVGSTFIP